MNLGNTARKIKHSLDPHRPIVEVGISRENLLHNLHTYQQNYPHLKFAPVLKSNAYGHGLTIIAELLDKEPIAFFMVDSYFEARTLRQAGIRSRIAVIGYVRPEEIASSRLSKIDFGIVDIIQLRELSHLIKRPTRIHLKLDTGMHRQGIMPQDLDSAISIIKNNPKLQLIGVCSHFADADNPDPETTEGQVATWLKMSEKVLKEFPNIEYRHIAATKGVAFGEEAQTNVGRLGIGLYGFDTSPNGSSPLKPVLEMRTLITSIREIPQGDFVGYNATFHTSKTSRIATVPVGYFEGIDRALSNNGSFEVRDQLCKLAGRISMNMSSIDVSELQEVNRGDTVIAIGRDSQKDNSVERMAKLAGTTPYVILVHIPQYLRRVVE